MARSRCGTDEQLRRYLGDEVAGPWLHALREHVAHCEACQARLERLTADSDLRRRIDRRSLAAVPQGLVGLTPLMERLRAFVPVDVDDGEAHSNINGGGTTAEATQPNPTPAPGRLDFLGPAQVEGDLGTINGFRATSELGRGGMGVVLKGHDPALDRAVAIKILPSWRDAAGARERFEREAKAAAQVEHPNVVSLHAVGHLPDGRPYLVMPYIQGPTLLERLQAPPPLTSRELAQIVAAIADGLDAVHQQGLVHRDVKPENILLSRDGTPLLMDFGLARRDHGEVTVTLDGEVLGTPAYMSPEQARGDTRQVDRRADVYSLGVLLYQLLTGEQPFRGNPRMMLNQVLHDEPRNPRSLNDRIPRDLETICLKAMQKEPGRRYPTAADLAADLRRWLDGELIQARPSGRVERTWRRCRRNPAQAMAAGLTVAVAVLSMVLAWHEADAARRLSKEQTRTQWALTQAQRLSAGLALDRGLSFCEQGDTGAGLLWMAQALELAPPDAPTCGM